MLSHIKGAGGTDPPGADIRDTPEMSNAQWDELLFKTEPLQGARPRWDEDGRPPVVFHETGVVEMEPAGVHRNVEQRGAPTPMLPPEQRILQEEEVRTPQRKGAHGHGGHRAPEYQLPPEETQVVSQIFSDVRARDVGPDRRIGSWSPGNVLEDTLARMQWDLAEIRVENRLLRTPGVQPVVPTPRQAALTTTKVPWFGGTTSWEQHQQVFDAIVLSNGWDDATAALQLLSHLQGDALSVALLVPMTRRTSKKGLVDALSVQYGSPGRLEDYIRQFEKTTGSAGDDPSIFAIALEALAVKAFGDMGQTARLWLIHDRFIAGHRSCIDTWIVHRQRLLSGMLWTDVESGRVTRTQRYGGSVSLVRNLSIRHMWSVSRTTGSMKYEWRRSTSRSLLRIRWRICSDDCWQVWLPRFRSQLRFRRFLWWNSYCSV